MLRGNIKYLILLPIFCAFALGTGQSGRAADGAMAAGQWSLHLGDEVIGMTEVKGPGMPGELAVFVADRSRPVRQRAVVWLSKSGSELTRTGRLSLPSDVAGYDVCPLTPGSRQETLLLVRGDGIYQVAAGKLAALVHTPTLFVHSRDDAFPKIRLCFALYGDGGVTRVALVVPTLGGIDVFRATPGPSGHDQGAVAWTYVKQASLASHAEPHYQWATYASAAEDQGNAPQKISLRLDYPEVTAIDFNRDGKVDLCLSLGEALKCYLQGADGFSPEHAQSYHFDLLTDAERRDGSVHVDSELVQLTRDGLPSLVLQKSTWGLADMATTLYVFHQEKAGGYAGSPAETITRQGYFAFHQFVDIDGDGARDLVAPVLPLGWSDLARIYFAKSADIDFVWYKNQNGIFATSATTLHSLTYPVEFKNMAALLGALPLFDIHLAGVGAKVDSEPGRQIVFFPGKDTVEVYGIKAQGSVLSLIGAASAPVGSLVLKTDLGGDGKSQLIFAYPREQNSARADLVVMLDGVEAR